VFKIFGTGDRAIKPASAHDTRQGESR